LEQRIKARLAQLRAEADAYKHQAEQQLAAYNGAIGELEKLLKETDGGSTIPGGERGPAVSGFDHANDHDSQRGD
jgi:hypothetical protein